MNKIICILAILIATFSYGQLPSEEIVESNKFNCDSRILVHYTNEEILAMDSMEFEMVKYYLVDSYVLSDINGIDVSDFDITTYEKYRSDSSYTIHALYNGIKIVFIPRAKMQFKVTPIFKYSFALNNENTMNTSKNIHAILMKIFSSNIINYQYDGNLCKFESSKNINYFYISEAMSDVGYSIKEFDKKFILKQ